MDAEKVIDLGIDNDIALDDINGSNIVVTPEIQHLQELSAVLHEFGPGSKTKSKSEAAAISLLMFQELHRYSFLR